MMSSLLIVLFIYFVKQLRRRRTKSMCFYGFVLIAVDLFQSNYVIVIANGFDRPNWAQIIGLKLKARLFGRHFRDNKSEQFISSVHWPNARGEHRFFVVLLVFIICKWKINSLSQAALHSFIFLAYTDTHTHTRTHILLMSTNSQIIVYSYSPNRIRIMVIDIEIIYNNRKYFAIFAWFVQVWLCIITKKYSRRHLNAGIWRIRWQKNKKK